MKRELVLSVIVARSSEALAHAGHQMHFHPHTQGHEGIPVFPILISLSITLIALGVFFLASRKGR